MGLTLPHRETVTERLLFRVRQDLALKAGFDPDYLESLRPVLSNIVAARGCIHLNY